MRASRLLTILMRLQLKGRVSARDLARDLEVSVRTIYRDVDQLSAAGIPIFAERGRLGGFELHEGFRTRLTGLTEDEAQTLLLAGIGEAAADLGLGESSASARLKILASLSPSLGARALKIGERFHLDPRDWYGQRQVVDFLPSLASAVWNDRQVYFAYESWKGEVTRRADPLGLVLKGGAWYLVAAVAGDPRTYRVSSMKSLEILESSFNRPPAFELGRHWAAGTQDFEDRILVGRATVQVSPAGMSLLRDVAPSTYAAALAGQAPCEPEGWIQATIPVEAEGFTARMFLRLGRDLVVLEPPSLRRAITREARAVIQRYARTQSGN